MSHFKSIFLLAVLLVLPGTLFAAEINRNILAVIDFSELKDESYNLIEKFAETPLNHLGFKVEYVDVSQYLPDDKEMTKYAGIVSWFLDNQLKGAPDYARWLTRQILNGKKVAAIGNFGFFTDEKGEETPNEVMDEFYKAFQISYDWHERSDSPLLIEVLYKDPKMTEFERKLSNELTNFEKINVLDKQAKVYLKLKRKDTGAICDAVFIHSKGGAVLSDYAIFLNPETFESRWRIDPFTFFAKIFGSDFPKPDITTINGVRMFMSHIDGDGIRNISDIDGKTPSGKVAYDEIFTKFNVPVSVSVVIGDLVLAQRGEREALFDTIRKIFALPNIEPASHGWAHPLVWDEKRRSMAYDLKGYFYSPQNEIGESLKYINEHLVPKGKKANLFFWTGNCRPDFDALKYVYDNNIGNINGGDTRFDSQYPSYTYVSPPFHHVGGFLQNFSADANEVTFTNLWTGPFYGFKYVVETYQNTESPIRLRPIDVYYHFYNMERRVSADTLKNIYDWVATQETAPVFISGYLDKLKGFLSSRIEKISPDRFVITGNSDLRSVRIDDYDGYVDVAASRGVMGFLSHQGSLYIHLDNGESSEIRLTKNRPATPYLAKANGEVSNWKVQGESVSFDLRTMGRLLFKLAGTKGAYDAVIGGKSVTLKSNERGEIFFSEPLDKIGFETVKISLTARRGGPI